MERIMKKAFTLIELLVVIAIIAILAAILFPVFAQAKLAAKKTTSLSNQKQINLGVILYVNDNDDTYPRNDGCTLNDSMIPKYNVQPAGTDPTPWCNGTKNPGQFAFRDNHYNWQKWILPYVKSVNMFLHPTLPLITGTGNTNGVWNGVDNGEIGNGYALNIAITGALNTWPTPAKFGAYRESFIGGTQSGLGSPAEALLTTEQSFFDVTGAWETNYNGQTTPYWPAAFKEHWEALFMKSGGTGDCGVQTGVVDPTKVPFNVIPIGFADGHVKSIAPGQFLANSPTYAEYVGQPLDTGVCKYFAAYGFGSFSGTPALSAGGGKYPMWGL
jgi:prepilin-type N-terminal cleavage/methylation domain-containing protein